MTIPKFLRIFNLKAAGSNPASASNFANQGDVDPNTQIGEMVPWANAHSETEKFSMIAPYGRFPHPKGLQVFEREDAEAIVKDFHRFANIGIRTLGIPFYKGHPDVPEFRARGHIDEESKGRVKELEARSDGLYGRIKWNEDGRKLIEKESFHGISPTWRVDKRGNEYHPISLKSVGLTNEPNIPVPPILANAQELENMKKLATQLGLPEGSTEDQISAKLTEMANSITTAQATIAALKKTEEEYNAKKQEFANASIQLGEAQKKITALEGEKTTLANSVTALTTERDTFKTNFANERKAHSKLMLDQAQKEGRISAADRTTYEAELANEQTFANAVTKLGQAKSTLPVRGTTVTRDRNALADEGKRQAQIQEFCNAKMNSTGCSYQQAWDAAKREKPEFFANMTQPEHAIK